MTVPMPRPSRAQTLLGLAVTNIIKLIGLGLAIHTISTEPNPSFITIAAEMFMLTGAQATEEQILKLIARMFGGPTAMPPPEQRPEDDGRPK